jgi:hypothetical protein
MIPKPASRRQNAASNGWVEIASGTGLSSAEESPGTLRLPSGNEEQWSYYLRPSLPADRLAERREIIGVIDLAAQQGDTQIDFQHVAPAALKAVPSRALKALARHVTGLKLPPGLDALPRCLNRLKGLRSLEMAGCTAQQIDVTRWDLDTLTIRGRNDLRWIAANEGTSVTCPAPGIRRKVCVNVYRDGKLVGLTGAGSQRYIKVPARRDDNSNGAFAMSNGQPAFCQTITAWWLGARTIRHAGKRSGAIKPASDMYNVLKNRQSFRRAVTPEMETAYDATASHAVRNIMVGNDNFGKVIEREFRQMRRGGVPARKPFQMNSIDHAMGLELQIKNGRNGKPEYSLVFFDPNVTTTHVRIKYRHSREARDMTLTSLIIHKDMLPAYFEDQAPVVTLVDLDSWQPVGKRSLATMLTEREKRSTLTLNLMIRDGFDVAAEELIGDLQTMPGEPVDWKAILLATTSVDKLPVFILALEAGRPRLAAMLADVAINLIAEGAFERTTLFELLQQEGMVDGVGYTTLGAACDADDPNFVGQLIDVLVRPKADGLASPQEYESLLRNGGAGRPSPYAHAIQCGHIGAALSMVISMLRLSSANRITCAQVVWLVACRDGDGVPAIEKAFEQGDVELMLVVMKPLVSAATTAFSVRQLIALLTAARVDGTPALRAAYHAGRANILTAYGQLVLSAVSSERIRPLDAIVLLTAATHLETPREALLAMAPAKEMLRTLEVLLHDVRVARWLPDDLSEVLDALLADEPAATSSEFDTGSELSSGA